MASKKSAKIKNRPEIENIHWSKLLLDQKNPRLPESLEGAKRDAILEHLYDDASLLELIRSMIENGFFATEPLIVMPDESEEDKFVVLEGNRRLGALLMIHHGPEADELQTLDELAIDYDDQDIKALEKIPCLIYRDRDSTKQFLGYRHISGLEKWGPEAKARYLLKETKAVAGSVQRPFYTVGRQVGSNRSGVRNSVVAILILLTARDEFKLDVTEVQTERFGVWMRCLNTAETRHFIGLDEMPDEYEDALEAMDELSRDGLEEVIGHLSGGSNAVLKDSRDATVYGQVLASERALETLRETGSLSLAKIIIERGSLDTRIRELSARVAVLKKEIESAEWSEELMSASLELFRKARALKNDVKSLKDEEEDED